MNWRWIEKDTILAIHEIQIAEHGGAIGLRDEGLLESALARPKNVAAYGSEDIHLIAAAYAFGVSRNHPFVDGNKRTALVLCELFLELNGQRLMASDRETLIKMISLAAGDLTEEEFAAWLRAECRPLPPR